MSNTLTLEAIHAEAERSTLVPIYIDEIDWSNDAEEDCERYAMGLVGEFIAGEPETETDPGTGDYFEGVRVFVSTVDMDKLDGEPVTYTEIEPNHPRWHELYDAVQRQALEEWS